MKKRKQQNKNAKKIIITLGTIATCIIIFSVIFAIININNKNISKGVKIEGIEVSGLTREQAKEKLEEIYKTKDITLKYEDYETTITQEELETKYDIDTAVNQAILVGKEGNIITNNYNIFFALIGKKDIAIDISINKEKLQKEIEDIQTNLSGTIEEPDYYI